MGSTKIDIEFTVWAFGEEHRMKTHWGEYRDLRALLHDKLFLDEFGQCGGMGRCATCLVMVQSSEKGLGILQRNEETTLIRNGQNNENIRLACQIAVDDTIANAYIQLLDNC